MHQIMPGLHHFDPTESQLRWQAMTSLAYGASGVMYFCYWSPIGTFALGGGLIVPRGIVGAAPAVADADADASDSGSGGEQYVWERGPHWYHAQRLNSVLRVYGGFLLGRRSVGVYRACGGTVGCTGRGIPGGGTPTNVGGDDNAPCLIQTLTDSGAGFGSTPSWLVGQFSLVGAPLWGGRKQPRPRTTGIDTSKGMATGTGTGSKSKDRGEVADDIRSLSELHLDKPPKTHQVVKPYKKDTDL
jgi:hypothetical protein